MTTTCIRKQSELGDTVLLTLEGRKERKDEGSKEGKKEGAKEGRNEGSKEGRKKLRS